VQTDRPQTNRSQTDRTYHDPLHGAITLHRRDPVEQLLIQLIDTPAFQRLRRVRQLGPASVTFHGAESSRFTHSLGVMAVTRRAFDGIARRYPQLLPHRAAVLCAALLHDIGHGPFSHTCEEIFGSHHEHWTQRILRESVPVRSRLNQFAPDLLQQIEQIYQKSHPVPLVTELVSSQLDCDRLDYLMRDSYFTGASYGKLDLDRILMAMDYDPDSHHMVVAGKSLAAIEHYLIVRYFMYAQVYNHPKNIAATWVLDKAFGRSRQLLHRGQLEADETVQAWLSSDCDQLTLQQYLDADDGVFIYHLQRWCNHADPTLADLCRRWCDRDLLKAMDVTNWSTERLHTVLQEMRSRLTTLGLEAEYYAGLRTSYSRGYTLYQRGINLKTEAGVREISELSPLVQTLTDPLHKRWLIYPREVQIN
jgi:uncharacterized protein